MQMNKNWISIHYLRGIAATLVVIHHIPIYLLNHGVNLDWSFHLGSVGVDIFFIISGFVMYLSIMGICNKKDAIYFFIRRIVRIVPLYWSVTLVTFTLTYFLPSFFSANGYSASELVKSMFFIPYANESNDMRPIVSQGWTLNFEMFFYAVLTFALILNINRAKTIAVLFLTISCLINATLPLSSKYQLFSPIVGEFCLGLLTANLLLNNKLSISYKFNLFFIIFLLIGFFGITESMVSNISFERLATCGVLSFLLVFSFLIVEKRMLFDNKKFFYSKSLIMLGDASYSIYLTHGFSFSIAWKLTKHLQLSDYLYSILFLLVSIILGVACYMFVEKAITLHLNKVLKGIFK